MNKSDLTGDFALNKAQVAAAQERDWHILQASAKSGENVGEAFEKLSELILEQRKASA